MTWPLPPPSLLTPRRRFHLLIAVAGLLIPIGLLGASSLNAQTSALHQAWEPVGLSGGGGMFAPAISSADPNLMWINCDMSGAYLSLDGGHNWRMINQAQLRSDTRCRPAFHPTNRNIIYASSGGRLKVSRDCGQTFKAIGNLSDGLDAEVAINPLDPDVLLAATGNGRCWLSRDAGATFAPCSGPEGKFLGFHFGGPAQRRTVFAATRKGIWRSDDGGQTWADKSRALPWKEIQGFAGGSANSASILYCTVKSKVENASFKGGVYRSRDGAESWEPAMGSGLNTETSKADDWAYGSISQYEQILTTDAKPLTVYVMNTSTGFHPPHSDTVYRSDDGGDSWRATYFMDPRFEQYNVAPDYGTASTGQSFKGGETPFGTAICSSDPERLLLVRNECHITHNGGKTWFCGSTSPAPGEKPGPGSAWLCNGLVVTTTWHHYIDPFEPNRHYICYTDLGWARSLDAGKSWIWWNQKSWAPWRNTCYELAFDPAIPGKLWGAFSDVHDIPNDNIIAERHGHNGPGGVCLSLDFGAAWRPVPAIGAPSSLSASKGALPLKAVTSIVLDPRSPKGARTLYAGVFDAGVFKSVDDGNTWVCRTNGLGSPLNLRVSKLLLHQDGTLFAMICAKRPAAGKPLMPEGVGLYRSEDGAENWQKVNASQDFLYPKDFSVHPRDSRRLLIGACDTNWEDKAGGLYATQDGGRAWNRITRQGPQTFGGYFHPRHDGWIYLSLTEDAPGAGLWLSRDNGLSWRPFDDLPFSNIQRVELDPADDNHIYVTTFGGSVWHGPAVPGSMN
jgi:photosystem II stability/assembly factor-like uncharacterized protein